MLASSKQHLDMESLVLKLASFLRAKKWRIIDLFRSRDINFSMQESDTGKVEYIDKRELRALLANKMRLELSDEQVDQLPRPVTRPARPPPRPLNCRARAAVEM
jgi:hypothetical protein